MALWTGSQTSSKYAFLGAKGGGAVAERQESMAFCHTPLAPKAHQSFTGLLFACHLMRVFGVPQVSF